MTVAKDKTAVIEDLEHLDAAGVGANEAAERTGFPSAEAMKKWLERHDAYDLRIGFKKRDPVGFHTSEQRSARSAASKADEWTAVLDTADQSSRARTRNKSAKARELLAELRRANAYEATQDAAKAEARKEIERLERELAKAKERLRGGKRTTLTIASSVSAAEIRAWAASNGVECPPMGRVPNAVREQFEATA